jgi:hypothetical protein
MCLMFFHGLQFLPSFVLPIVCQCRAHHSLLLVLVASLLHMIVVDFPILLGFWDVFFSRMEIWMIVGLRQLCFQFKPNPFCQKQQTPCCVRQLCMVSFTVSWQFLLRTWRT